MKRNIPIACAAVGIIAIAGCSMITGATGSSSSGTQAMSACAPEPQSGHYVGFSVGGFPPNPAQLSSLEQATGVTATAVSLYMSLGSKIDMSAVTAVCAQGALPVIEIDSDRLSLRDVADGSQDGALASYARELAAINYPVAIDFDHEFNGPWFDWGYKYQTATEFVAAWRHIVSVFRINGATQVKWVWNPNVNYNDTTALRPWYPGDAYVTLVGLDGYFTSPSSTFHSVFDPTLLQVRQFTSRPILIVETGANPSSKRPRAIASLFAGASNTPGIVGLIWFDYKKYAGHDWYIDNDPAALAAFREASRNYIKGP